MGSSGGRLLPSPLMAVAGQIKELALVAASIAEEKKEEMTVLITTAIAFIAILLAEHWFF